MKRLNLPGVTAVIGSGRSGLDAAMALLGMGALVVLSDRGPVDALNQERIADVIAAGGQFIIAINAEPAVPAGTKLVVVSPGVPLTAPPVERARALGIPVWSEIELGARISEAPIAAITGTNGKTTSTLLLHEMFVRSGIASRVCGNISADHVKQTLVAAACEATADSVLTAEISSFQLESTEAFAPQVGAITNVTPDHLDRYANMEQYAAAKAKIFASQSPDQWAVLNADNFYCRQIGERPIKSRRIWVSSLRKPELTGGKAWFEDDRLFVCLRSGENPLQICEASDLPMSLSGRHNIENVLTASSMALALGASAEGIFHAISKFKGVPHRMETVAVVNGVTYINNSMCTNTEAAVSSLAALRTPAIVIAGGAGKGLDYAPMAAALTRTARFTLLMGANADEMQQVLHLNGYTHTELVSNLESGLAQASKLARPGECVILCPAAASFDMFRDFEDRGTTFRRLVSALVGEPS